MNKTEIQEALENLERIYNNKEGYTVKQILSEMNIDINRKNEKLLRSNLRAMISKNVYPQFLTAKSEDIVYCPNDKGSGTYRLSKFRGK